MGKPAGNPETVKRGLAALLTLVLGVGIVVVPTLDTSVAAQMDIIGCEPGSTTTTLNPLCPTTTTTAQTTTTTEPVSPTTVPATTTEPTTTTEPAPPTTTSPTTTTAPATTTTTPATTTTLATTTTTTQPAPVPTVPEGDDDPAKGIDKDDDPAKGIDKDEDPAKGIDKDEDPAKGIDKDEDPAKGIEKDEDPAKGIGEDRGGHEEWDHDDRDRRFGKDGKRADGFVYDMLWPVLGGGYIGSPFGAPRDGGARSHKGNDLMADKLQPIVAVADGVVFRAATDSGISGTIVGIRHDDGWSSYYIHLNNDRYNTDDGRGYGIRPGIEVGKRVRAGDLIGWNGDSGNAENTVSHLHFELHTPSGAAIDPEASLRAALNKAEWPHLAKGAKPFDGAYWDDDGSPVEELVDTLVANQGVVLGCGRGGYTLCAQDDVTPRQLRSLLREFRPSSLDALDGLETASLFRAPVKSRGVAGLGVSIGSLQKSDRRRVTEADIGRIVAAESEFDPVQVAALYASADRSNPPPTEPHRRVESYAAGETLDLLQREGLLDECVETLDDTESVDRITAINLIAQTTNSIPGPCERPGDGQGPGVPPGPAVERWRELVEEYFPRGRVEEAMRVLACESEGNPNAVNPTSDATGLFQFIPTTWVWASAAAGYGGYDRTHHEANVASAAWLTSRDHARGDDAWRAWECKP